MHKGGRIMADKASETDPRAVPGRILVGKSQDKYEYLTLGLGNRHGLVTGATGTGKTVSLQVLAEGFSNAGTPVFAADVKGDLAGLAMPGDGRAPLVKRGQDIGVPYAPDNFPVVFWDLLGEQGHPVRATISEMGPLLLARLLELNDTQEGVLNIAFRLADEQGLALLDLKDLRAVLTFLADNSAEVTTRYGNVATATVGTIQRQLLVLENQHADLFFGEPALDINDFLRTDRDGRGIINILAADKLMRSPRLYATFLLWMLSELFERLPEVGDPEKPKLVFFFDEAHLLFNDAPKNLLTAIEQVVRLIRSKGVGVYFVTQNPLDVPETVLGQLGNRIQHALRAFTPRDQKAVRAAAETFRQNPAFDTAEAITQLGVGEALVSLLQPGGSPEIVTRSLIAPPGSRVGPITPEERDAIVKASNLLGKYDTPVDRESAFEILQARAQGRMEGTGSPQAGTGESGTAPVGQGGGGLFGSLGGVLGSVLGGGSSASAGGRRQRMSTTEIAVRAAVQSAARSAGTQIARAIMRGVLGSLKG
jgi:DNA helicase HerA-like ATPase